MARINNMARIERLELKCTLPAGVFSIAILIIYDNLREITVDIAKMAILFAMGERRGFSQGGRSQPGKSSSCNLPLS